VTLTRTASVAALAAATATLAACSYSAGPTTPTTSETTVTETESVTVAPVVTSSTASTASTPAPPSTSTSAVTAKHNTCANDALTVRVLPGGAIRGHEIAAVSVTNGGTDSCVVWGFPTVQLERSGSPLSTAATPTGTPHDVTLAPAAQAQALITDASTCNAPLSDNIRATLPESSLSVTRPMQMRGCTLQIAPFKPAE